MKEYQVQSTQEGFKDLSMEEQAKTLAKDALAFPCALLEEDNIPEEDEEELINIITSINKRDNLEDNIKKYIAINKKNNIEDYKILTGVLHLADCFGMNDERFIKTFILEPYYGCPVEVETADTDKSEEAPKIEATEQLLIERKPEESAKQEPSKQERKKPDEQPKVENKKQEQPKVEQKKSEAKSEKVKVKTTAGAAKNMGGTITASDIVNSCNEHSKMLNQQQPSIQGQQQHPQGCTCGHCKGNNQTATPSMSLDEKTELLKNMIDFSTIKGIHVKDWEVDNLLQFLASPIFKSKLKEYKSACNPDYPKMTLCSKKYKFDKNLYKFAFWTPTVNNGQVLVVLYNTNMTLVPNVGPTNNMGFILANESDVK